jgi:predicted ATPase
LAEKAIGYWLNAGQQAAARSAMREAVTQLQKGLDLLAELPEGSLRLQQELDLRIALGPALIATKGYSAADVGETIARARLLAEQLDRSDYLVHLLYAQWVFHLVRAEHKPALSYAEQLEKIGETRGDTAALLLGHLYRGLFHFFVGEFGVARSIFEQQCRHLSDPAQRAKYAGLTAEIPDLVMHSYLALVLSYLGYADRARSCVNDALTEARRLEHPYTLVVVSGLACWAEWPANSRGEVQRHADNVISLCNDHGYPWWLGVGMWHRGWSLTALGQAQEGMALLAQGLSIARATGGTLGFPFALVEFAKAHAQLGRRDDSLSYLAEAAHLIETTGERYAEAELHRLRGDLLNAAGNLTGAEQSYHQALSVAKQQSAKTFELRAATGLAGLWRDQGKREEARDLLAPVYGWFTEGYDTRDLKDAKALLDELAS